MPHVFWAPIVAFAVCQSTFLSTSIAVIYHHNVTWPYVSEGATYPPESCVFSEMINFASLLLAGIIYVRYRQIDRLLYHHVRLLKRVARQNVIALWFGLIACGGFSIVANFQLTEMPVVHYIGAFSCFGLGTVYFWMQGFISYSVRSHAGSKQMAYARISMAAICTCSFCIAVFTSCAATQIIFDEGETQSCRYKDYSSMAEWVIATAFSFFILSFTSDFKTIKMDRLIVVVKRKELKSNTDSSRTNQVFSISSEQIEQI